LKKLLVTASTFPRWQGDSTPDFIYQLVKYLTEDFDVYVLAPYAKGTKTFETFDNIKIFRYKYMPFGLGSLSYDGGMTSKLEKNKFYYFQIPFFLLFQLLSLMKIIKRENIDIIHSHWIIPQGFVAALYKRIFNKNIKILATSHGADIFTFDNIIGNFIKKFTLQNIDMVTAVSNTIKDKVMETGYDEDIRVYPMGVDKELFNPGKKDMSIRENLNIRGDFLLFVGRLSEKKGLKYLLEAMPDVIKEFPLISLIVIGDGPLKNDFIYLAKKLDIIDNVTFLGPLAHEKLPSFFATADIFIGPSITAKSGDSEGFGLVLAEAMSCGTLLLTTDLPVIKEIVKDNETGFIVKQKNSKELSEKILYLLKNKDKLDEIKSRAREHVIENFDWKIVGKKYIRLLKSLSMGFC
jgi:glycosyltransferase involved in cell wall biosynthesis